MQMRLSRQGGLFMRDIAFSSATVRFFLLSIAYVRFCDRVK